MKAFAKIISYVFQPLLMPSLVFYTMLYYLGNSSNLTDSGKWTVVSLIFFTTCLIPMVTVIMFRITKVIKDLHMKDRRDRFIPFVFITIFYLVVAVMIMNQDWMNDMMQLAFTAMTAVVVITNFITFKWKISAHAAGVAGWLGFAVAFSVQYPGTSELFVPIIFIILINGLVYWSRLYLNAHRPLELWAGAFLGFSVCYGAISYFL